MKHLLVGCSFTDPQWQEAVPWSVQYAQTHPSYIVAKAGMGIKGITTEALRYLKQLDDVDKVIIVLPTMWRMDIEMDEEMYLCDSMVDLLVVDTQWQVHTKAHRKWIISGGLNYKKNTEESKIFDLLYKHQGFLVLAKEHFRSLQNLIEYCILHNIDCYVSAIQDPVQQLTGLDYIREEFCALLAEVEYSKWIKFDGKFIDQFLGHQNHPTTAEHKILCDHILNNT